jgi:uncharacterized membrane protein (DUF485 family)
MLHEPAIQAGKDHAAGYKASLGVVMFIIYSLIYTGFVLLNVISPVSMEIEVFLGMNLACVYGFGLIIIALIQALIYDGMCRKQEETLNKNEEGGKK